MKRSDNNTPETYGLKLLKWPPQNQRNGTFWKRFMESCISIKVSKNKKQLPETVKGRCKGNQTIKQIFTDKTSNIYELDLDE